MNSDFNDKKNMYIAEARSQLKKFYSFGSSLVQKKGDLRNEIFGFFQAGILLKVISSEKVSELIAEEHFSAFGKTVKQRRIDKKLKDGTEKKWDKYDVPAYQRK